MNNITTIGLDLAKTIFHAVCLNQAGKIVKRKQLKRHELRRFFSQQPPCLIGMEACGSAHYWARELRAYGHTTKLIPAQYVKGFVRGNKNDYNDALAIAEAVKQAEMRFVAVKTPQQQDVQAMHRLRQQRIKERTALSNQLRGLLMEYGIVMTRGVNELRRRIPVILDDEKNGLTALFRQLLRQGYMQLLELDTHINTYTKILTAHSKQDDRCQRLQTIPGYGPIVASVFASTMGNTREYKRGRDASAALGVVPRQHSTGGQRVLLGISKRGDKYLRSLIIHGARAVVRSAQNKDDNLSRWVNRIRAERGYNKATVALANKMVRMGWAVLHYGTTYRPA